MRVLFSGRIGIWKCLYCQRRKTREPGEKPSEQDENQQQTQLTYGTGPELNPGHTGGMRQLSPLRHPCMPLKMHKYLDNFFIMVYNKQLVSTGTPYGISHNRHRHHGRLSETDGFGFTEIPRTLWNTIEKQNTLTNHKQFQNDFYYGFSSACHGTVFSRAFYKLKGAAFPAFFTGYISSCFSRLFHRRIDCCVFLQVESSVTYKSRARHVTVSVITLISINSRKQPTSAKLV